MDISEFDIITDTPHTILIAGGFSSRSASTAEAGLLRLFSGMGVDVDNFTDATTDTTAATTIITGGTEPSLPTSTIPNNPDDDYRNALIISTF